ncbi:hypothetical protein NQ314_007351 [Rhamnusium bicolor]|uniref:Uncharacterized protein n=1 Tax=Rhamnusium bicolor TaxID=1586634 RepID=A0AAV8YR97_9CUCU|nr:hypothetical protein NQ314_007351 [Rhamnusium bicolor]
MEERYLVAGSIFNALQYEYLVGASTVRKIVENTCEKVWSRLQPLYMPDKSEDDWFNISEGFYNTTNCQIASAQ